MAPAHVHTPLSIAPGASYIDYEPLGVVCVMGAWNFPIQTLLGPALQCVAAGNCVVFKASELAPHTSRALCKLVSNYLDRKFYRAIEGQVKVAIALTSMRFDMFVFTGST